MLTLPRMQEIVERVEYKDWHFSIGTSQGGHYLQLRWLGPDVESGETELQGGRKWQLSSHMTESELVQTCLKAVLAAEEHEARERFAYRGRAVFGPHMDVNALWSVANRQDRRAAV